ncbi:hypothetical protein B0H17DRAFT_1123734 [Mycena rosella]|uniref:Uncharacterized protein n=1 Tax=Mycena rosella TaxID=1033263 RepID=A0AAD7MCL7_MYCRO|nr:hypothetical protein B0H17DRAFT_1123734 [Mycena rosella]
MLWTPQGRQPKTRRGTTFSPYTPILEDALDSACVPLCSDEFDFSPLLADSVAHEHERDEDREHADDPEEDQSNTVDDVYPSPPPLPPYDPMNDVDDVPDRPAPPPPKRMCTAFDDMQEGKKPLTRAHRRQKEKHARDVEHDGHSVSTSTLLTHVLPALAAPVAADLNADTLPTTHGAYAAARESAEEARGHKKPRTCEELIGLGFQVIPWSGFDARPLVDVHGRIFAVLVRQPRSASWDADVWAAYHAIAAEAAAAAFPSEMYKHRRGLYAVLNAGLAYGKGQRMPARLHQTQYGALLDHLLGNPAVQRMATFASGKRLPAR